MDTAHGAREDQAGGCEMCDDLALRFDRVNCLMEAELKDTDGHTWMWSALLKKWVEITPDGWPVRKDQEHAPEEV